MIRKSLTPVLVIAVLALGVATVMPSSSATAKVSASRAVEVQNNSEISDASVSADGRWMVFSSLATNLVQGASEFSNVYAVDRQSGDVTLLTQVPGGGASDGDSSEPVVCGDGSVVAFTTESELLDPEFDDDFNGEPDVYIVQRDADGDGIFDEYAEAGAVRIVRVSVGEEGVESDFGATSPTISADCSTVGFVALDPLADDDLNDFEDVYVRDISQLPSDPFDFAAPVRASVAAVPSSTTGGGGVLPVLTGDGNKVVYVSTNGGHVTGDDAALGGVFLRDLEAGTTTHVSVKADGRASTGTPDTATAPAVTADGGCIAFRALALDLLPGLVQQEGVFVRDLRDTPRTLLASQSSRGLQATTAAGPAISPDCRFVGFDSGDASIVSGDDNNQRDAYIRDLETGGTEIVSRRIDSTPDSGKVAAGGSSVRQILNGQEAIVNSSAPNIGGADGFDGVIDPFFVGFYNLGFAPPRLETGEIRFTDVRSIDFFEQGVAWLSYHNITQGTGPRTYGPSAGVTRQQMAVFMWKMMGQPQAPSSCGLTDEAQISAGNRQAACWLKANGITNPDSQGRFNPRNSVTRGQMAAFLWRMAGTPESVPSCGFTDEAQISNDFRPGTCWLKSNGITNPDGQGRYNPRNVVTRGQMAAFLYRLAGTPDAWGDVDIPQTVTFPLPG